MSIMGIASVPGITIDRETTHRFTHPRTTPIPGLRQVADDPAAALANPKILATIRRALAEPGIQPVDIACMVGVSVTELFAAAAGRAA